MHHFNEHYVSYVCGGTLVLLLVGVVGVTLSHKAQADTATVSVEVVLYECSDGIDNDFDGQVDFPNDPGCESASDDDETDPQCLDGIDNDGDGLVDYPADPGCSAATDDDEADPVVVIPPSGGGTAFRITSSLIPLQAERVTFSGLAHSGGTVTLLQDGQLASTTQAGSDATFLFTLRRVPAGEYLFSLYGTDTDGVRSGMLSFSLTVPLSWQFDVSDIFIPPTISFLGEEGVDRQTLLGQTVPESDVHIVVFGDAGTQSAEETVMAESTGRYEYTFPSQMLDLTGLIVKSFTATPLLASPFGRAAGIFPSSRAPEGVPLRGDLNGDGRVNLVDFSIVAFWYKRPSPSESADLNNDGVVDLVDVSIMAFNWTG
jgi:hypothetical protein